jgi:hypothetical protein
MLQTLDHRGAGLCGSYQVRNRESQLRMIIQDPPSVHVSDTQPHQWVCVAKCRCLVMPECQALHGPCFRRPASRRQKASASSNLQFDILPDGDLRHDYRRFATCCCRPSNRDVIKGGVVRDDESQWVGLAIIRGTGPVRFRRTGRARPNCRLARTSWRKMITDRSDGSGYPDAPMQAAVE